MNNSAKELREKEQDDLIDLVNVNTTHGEKIKLVLIDKMLDKLITSLVQNTESTNALAQRTIRLNLVLTIATAIYSLTFLYSVLRDLLK